MNKKLLITLIIAVTMTASALAAQDISKVALGARYLSLGGTYTSIANDTNSLFTNPAGLGAARSWGLTSSSTKILGRADYKVAGVIYPTKFGTIGIGYVNASTPAGLPYDSSGNLLAGSSLSYSSSIIYLSYGVDMNKIIPARDLGSLTLGCSVKLLKNEFGGISDASGSGTAVDLGAQFQPNNWFALGASMQNTSGAIEWKSGKKEQIPSLGKLGTSLKLLQDKLTIGIDADFSTGRPIVLHTGAEFNPVPFLSIRGGIDQDPINTSETINNLTAGVGINFAGFKFDYAYRQDSTLTENSSHYFSLSYSPEPRKTTLAVKEETNKKEAVANTTSSNDRPIQTSQKSAKIATKVTPPDQRLSEYYKIFNK
jgi:hypothetical protein